MQRALAIHLIEEVNKALCKSHQKIIVATTVPANAMAIQLTMRAALVDARVMHAGLTNGEMPVIGGSGDENLAATRIQRQHFASKNERSHSRQPAGQLRAS